MPLASEIIYGLRALRSGRTTDEEALSDAQWMYLVDLWRAKLLRQEVSDGKRLVGTIQEQTIEVPLERLVPQSPPLPGRALPSAYKCPQKLPVLLNTKWGSTPSFVGRNLLSAKAQQSSLQTIRYQLAAPLTGHSDRFILTEQDFYFYSTEGLTSVSLSGVFESPYQVEVFMGRDNPFSPYSFEYPLSQVHLDGLYRGLADTELRILKASLPDLDNDGHEPTTQSQGRN